ncbi:MAG: phage Gp37/Gp68 family protein [Thermoleophilia bacterium]
MSENSNIAWTGNTFNPWSGCRKVSEACKNCYAETLPPGMRRHAEWGDHPRVMASDSYWKQPIAWSRKAEKEGTRVKVFCGSTCDVFEELPELVMARRRLWELIEETKRGLIWQLLTKRPEAMLAWNRSYWWPINAWAGVTAENQQRFDERYPFLRQVKAPVRFLSCEPLLGPIQLNLDGIHWVIAGGESGPNARPTHPDWVRGLRDQCLAAGVPYFFKQWGEYGPGMVDMCNGMPVFDEMWNYQRWVSKASTHISRTDACMDKKGRVLNMGIDFMRARDEDAFPVTILSRLGKHNTGAIIDGREWREFPGDGEPNQEIAP